MSAVSYNIRKALQKINIEILREMQDLGSLDLQCASVQLDMRSGVGYTADII